ncbi:MAG: hypothetical protein AAFV88_01800 [Planctomycetota bacterium]
MKAFGVRFAAGGLTILLGAIMAAQAQKDQQAATDSAWTEQQLPTDQPPMPIGLSEKLDSQNSADPVSASVADSSGSGVISAVASQENRSDFGAVALVQHTDSGMKLPEVTETDPSPTEPVTKTTMRLPTFDEAPQFQAIQPSGSENSNPDSGPAVTIGLPSQPSVQDLPSSTASSGLSTNSAQMSDIRFADTPMPGATGAEASEAPASSVAMPIGSDSIPVNDLRGSGNAPTGGFGDSTVANPSNTPPSFRGELPMLPSGDSPSNGMQSHAETSSAPNLRFNDGPPVQVGIGEQAPAPRADPRGLGGARSGLIVQDQSGVNAGSMTGPTGGMSYDGPAYEPPVTPNNQGVGDAAVDYGPNTAVDPYGQSPDSQPGYSQPAYGQPAPNPSFTGVNQSAQPAAGNRFGSQGFAAPLPSNQAPEYTTTPNGFGRGNRFPQENTRPQDRSVVIPASNRQRLDALPAPRSSPEQTGNYGVGQDLRVSSGSPSGMSMATPGDHRLDGPQNASVVIDKRAPAEVKVGKPASFVITVRNVGASKALDVKVFDRVPTGTVLTDSTPPPNPKFQPELYWELGDMEPGEERIITLQLVPQQEGELGSVATVAYRATASVRTVSTRPELKVVQRAPERVLIGQQVEIELEVSNPGTGEATGVVLQEDVPAALQHPQGARLDSVIGTLGPGQIRRQILRMKAVKPGIVENMIRVKADDGLETSHTVAMEVVAPDVRLALSGPKRRYLERQATYEVKVGNVGTADAQNLEMSVQLDRGFTFVKTNNQGQYDPSRHAVFWSLQSLAAGTDASVSLTLLPVEEGSRVLQTNVTADLGVNSSIEDQVLVDSLAELTFAISDSADPIEVGGQTIYEIRVNNSGSRDDTNVEVLLQLPDGLQLVQEGDFTPQGRGKIMFPTRSLLKANDEMVFRVKAVGLAPGRHLVRAVVRSDQSDVAVTKEESIMVYSDR